MAFDPKKARELAAGKTTGTTPVTGTAFDPQEARQQAEKLSASKTIHSLLSGIDNRYSQDVNTWQQRYEEQEKIAAMQPTGTVAPTGPYQPGMSPAEMAIKLQWMPVLYRTDSTDVAATFSQNQAQTAEDTQAVRALLEQHPDLLDADSASKIKTYLDDVDTDYSKLATAGLEDAAYWDQIRSIYTEEEYTAAVRQQAKINVDPIARTANAMNHTVGNDEKSRATRRKAYESTKARIADLEQIMLEEERKNRTIATGESSADIAAFFGDKIGGQSRSDRYKKAEEERDWLLAQVQLYEDGVGYNDRYDELYGGAVDFDAVSGKRDYTNTSPAEWETWYGWYSTKVAAYPPSVDKNGEEYYQGLNGEKVPAADLADYIDRTQPRLTDPLGFYQKMAGNEFGRQRIEDVRSGSAASVPEWFRHIERGIHSSWDELTDKETAMYYYLLGSEGESTAMAYLDGLTTELNRREALKESEALTELFQEASLPGKIALSVATLPAQAVGSVSGGVADAVSVLKGDRINPYSHAHAPLAFSQTVRDLQARELTEATGNARIPLLDFTVGDAYQALMSAGDMLSTLVLGPTGYGVSMGLGAFSSTAKEMYEQGATNAQIVAGSALAGIAEGFFEKYSIDKLIKIGNVKSVGQVLKNWFFQMGIEGSEEMATEAANLLADALIRQGTSGWQQMLEKNNGNQLAALGEAMQQTGKAGMSGMIAGGLGGAGTSVGSYAGYRSETARLQAEYMKADWRALATGAAVSESEVLLETAQRLLAQEPNNTALSRLIRKAKANPRYIGQLAFEVQEAMADGRLQAADTEAARRTAELRAEEAQRKNTAKNDGTNATSLATENLAQSLKQTGNTPSVLKSSGETISKLDLERRNGKTRLRARMEDGTTYVVDPDEVGFADEAQKTLYQKGVEYDLGTDAGNLLMYYYPAYQDRMSPEEYARGFAAAYNYGRYGMELRETDQLVRDAFRLDETFRKQLYKLGREATDAEDIAAEQSRQQRGTQQGSVVRYRLRPYTKTQIEDWKNSKRIVVYKDEIQLKQFIDNALTAENITHKKLYFGAVPSPMAADIRKSTGIDVEGYNISLSEDEIRKIRKDHGNEENESKRGQRAVTKEDYIAIPDILQSPDKITLSPKKYAGKPVIRFEKINGSERITIIAVVSDKHLDLFVETMYANKKGSMATPIPEQAGINTPEASSGTAPMHSISGSSGKVNPHLQTRGKNGSTKTTTPADAATKQSRLSGEAQGDDDTHFQLRENLGEQFKDWLEGGGKKNGTYNGRYFELGTTPDIFVKHGAPQAELIMYEDCVIKVTGGKGDFSHEISLEELANLPGELNDPVLLFSGRIPDSFVALTELLDKHGNDEIAAVHINRRHGRTVINKIASVYSKTDNNGNNKIERYIQQQISNGKLLDASTKKAPMWFTRRGLQLPKLVQTIIDANTIVSDSSGKSNPHLQTRGENSSTKTATPADAATKQSRQQRETQIIPEMRFSIKNTINVPLDEQVRRYNKGTLSTSDAFYFGETPKEIVTEEFGQLPLVLSQTDYKKSRKEKHSIPLRVMKNLHKDLSGALFSIDSKGRYGFVTADIDGDGKPVLIAINTNAEMDHKPIHRITSVYGLDNPTQWLKNQVEGGKRFIVYNKESAENFLQTYGYLALVEGNNQRFDNSISDSSGKSNPHLQTRGENGSTKTAMPADAAAVSKARPGADMSAIRSQQLTKRQRASISVLDTLGKAIGVRFSFYASVKKGNRWVATVNIDGQPTEIEANGMYFDGGNTVYLDIYAGENADGTILYTASHELVHFIKDWSPTAFRRLQRFLMRELGKSETEVQRWLEDKKALLLETGQPVTDERAMDEVTADACEMLLSSEQFAESLQRLSQVDRQLHQKIVGWLRTFINKMRTALKFYAGKPAETTEGRVVAEMVDSLQELADHFAAALLTASQNMQTAEKTWSDARTQDVHMSIHPNFFKQFDAWDGKNPSTTFTIGNTSDVLQSIGVKNQDFQMHSGMILRKINKHEGITRETFRQIPELLEDPILIQFSDAIDPETGRSKYDSRITVLGELYAEMTENGKKQQKPVLVSIELLPSNKARTRILDVSIITSAYGHSKLQQYLENNSILYICPDKKRTTAWLSLNRLQLPVGETKRGSIRRIAYSDGKVKIENSKNQTPMQKRLQDAGIVDSYGHSMLENVSGDTLHTQMRRVRPTNEDSEGRMLITPNMSDRERAQILRKRVIRARAHPEGIRAVDPFVLEELAHAHKSRAGELLRELAERCGIFKDYINSDVELHFGYSQRSLAESLHKQNERYPQFSDFAKLLTVFDEVIANAQLIESHTDRYVGTRRENQNLKAVHVLLSGFQDGAYFVPVELNVKEFFAGTQSKLYVSATLQKMETDLVGQISNENRLKKYPKPVSTYSITEILKYVNPLEEDFLKYIPDELLTAEQRQGKERGIRREKVKLLDMRYAYAVKRSDWQRAGELLREAAGMSETDESTETVQYDKYGEIRSLSSRFGLNVPYPRRNIHYQQRGRTAEQYSYEALVSKPDMPVTVLKKITDQQLQKYRKDTDLLAADARKNARATGNPKNTDSAVYLRNNDTGKDVLISRDSFKHGAKRFGRDYTAICLQLPEILKNAIAVNELTSRENTDGSVVLLGMARYGQEDICVRLIINRRQWKLESYDLLYAIKSEGIKKEDVGSVAHGLPASRISDTSSVISISDMLAFVKQSRSFSSVVSQDVLDALGSGERLDESFRDQLHYQKRGRPAEQYSYEALVSKPPLVGTVIDPKQQIRMTNDGRIDTKWLTDQVKSRCRSIRTKAPLPTYYLDVPAIGRAVEITNAGIEHGYITGRKKNRKSISSTDLINARAALALPEILANSIEVNLSQRGDNPAVPYSHILLGTVAMDRADGTRDYYAVRSVVEEREHRNPVLVEANILGNLKGINAKKVDPANGRGVVKNVIALPHAGAYTYSIADLLDDVKNIFSDTFSADVYAHFNQRRRKTPFSENLRYQKRGRTAEQYSYEALVSKPPLVGMVIDPKQQIRMTNDGRIDTKWLTDQVKSRCRSIRTKAPLPTYYLDVPAIGREVEITNAGIEHGYIKGRQKGRSSVPKFNLINARAALALPEILANSIEVNLSQRGDNPAVPYSHILLGTVAMDNADGTRDYYAVRSVVEEREHRNPVLVEANILGNLKGINAKKVDPVNGRGVVKNVIALPHTGVYTYNIADLLNDVKDIFTDTFSADVYAHFNQRRRQTPFSENLRYQKRGRSVEQYSYEALVSKPDMVITPLDVIDDTKFEAYQRDTGILAKEARDRARASGHPKNTDSAVFLQNRDTGRDILVGIDSFKHGSKRFDKAYAAVCLQLSEILENAVAVNELRSRENTDGSVVLLGMARYGQEDICVRLIINQRQWKLESYDILYAIKKERIKKEGVDSKPTDYRSSRSSDTPSVISISDLLDSVKQSRLLSSVVSQDVLDTLGSGERLDESLHDQLRYQKRGRSAEQYSYEALVSKPDMPVIAVTDNVPADRAEIVRMAKENAAKVGRRNPDGSVVVKVQDTGDEVVLTTHGLRHGLRRKPQLTQANGMVTVKAGEIIQHSVRINELIPEDDRARGTYVLIGVAQNENEDLYIVRSVVNRYDNELVSMDALYAINAKTDHQNKKGSVVRSQTDPDGTAATKSPRLAEGPLSVTGSTLSIRDLLDYVNQYLPDILPEDVLRRFGYTERPRGDLGASALFQLRGKNGTIIKEVDEIIDEYPEESTTKKAHRLYKENSKRFALLNERLAEVNRELRGLTFGKGERDSAYRQRKNELQREADRLIGEIEEIEPALIDYMQSSEYKELFDQAKKRAYSRRQRADERDRVWKNISYLTQRLLNGSKNRNVKLELQPVIRETLIAVDALAKRNDEDIYTAWDRLISAYAKLEKSEAIITEGMSDAAKRAAEESAQRARSLYQPWLYQQMDEIRRNVIDGRSMSRLELNGLREINRVLEELRHLVAYADTLMADGKRVEARESAQKVIDEIRAVKKESKTESPTVTKCFRKFSWEEMTPVYFFRRLGSLTLQKLYGDLLKGQDVYARDLQEAQQTLERLRDKHGYKNWDMDQSYDFEVDADRTFTVNLQQIMSIYAYSKREQADKHMREGGFVFETSQSFKKRKDGFPLKYEHIASETYQMTDELLGAITGTLTAEQKAFVDELQAYLSGPVAVKGNEVARVLYGIDIFNEKNYWPLQSQKDFIASPREALAATLTQTSLKNTGMTRPTDPRASNPIVLRGLEDVWGEHVVKMAQYHGFVLPIDSLQQVFNYTVSADTSVKTAINGAFGPEATAYLDKFITDLNGGITGTGGMSNAAMRLFGKFKKAKTAMSLSTIVQQPTAVIRAMTQIDPKYFAGAKVQAKTNGIKEDRVVSVGVPPKGSHVLPQPVNSDEPDSFDEVKRHRRTWEKIKQYAPIAIIKEMGGYDAGSGHSAAEYVLAQKYDTLDKKAKGILSDSYYRDEVFMRGAAKADEFGWSVIWNAVEREVADITALRPGSKAFYEACGERFTDVISKTQVYDSVLSRSGIMRDPSDVAKFATSFMGEPTVNVNMLADALIQWSRTGDGKLLFRTTFFVLAAQMAASVAASFVYAMRDDDEDEAFLEKWMYEFGGKLRTELNPFAAVPFARDVVSLSEGRDVDRPDMTIIADLITAVQGFADGVTVEEILNAASIACEAYGVPARNIIRDMRAVGNFVRMVFDDVMPTAEEMVGYLGRGIAGSQKQSDVEAVYRSLKDGDPARVERAKARFDSEEDYTDAIKQSLRNYDPRVRQAVVSAVIDGNYSALATTAAEIQSEGKFDETLVTAAVKAEYNYLTEQLQTAANYKAAGKETEFATTLNDLVKKYGGAISWDEVRSLASGMPSKKIGGSGSSGTGVYSISMVRLAVDVGNGAQAVSMVQQMYQQKAEELAAGGMSSYKAKQEAQSRIQSSLSGQFCEPYKEAYLAGDTETCDRIREFIRATGMYKNGGSIVYDWQAAARKEKREG